MLVYMYLLPMYKIYIYAEKQNKLIKLAWKNVALRTIILMLLLNKITMFI